MKTPSDPTVSTIQNVADTITAFAKLLLCSRPMSFPKATDTSKPLLILGNGPSLRQTIDNYSHILKSHPTLAVNFAANTPDFFDLKPRYYVLADPLFFAQKPIDNIKTLIENLGKVDWPMTIFVPRGSKLKLSSKTIDFVEFNCVGIDGWEPLRKFAFAHKLAMPRPRNVLIPSIMLGIWLGYKQIYILGADHSWMRTLEVNEDNEVVSVQPHFYADSEKEQKRVRSDYQNFSLHQIIHSFYIAFRAYHSISRFAQLQGVDIINSTPGSFIDAFRRAPLPEK